MNVTLTVATTEAEREAIYRLRYEIYVEEMNIFGDGADHAQRRLEDANDATARLMYAAIDGEVVGSMRLNFGADAADLDALITQGYVFDCAPGDRVIRQGQPSQTVFVVLEGALQVHHDDGAWTEVQRGEAAGEPSFLLSICRTADVYAGPEGARVLSLNEARLRRLLRRPTPLAARLLMNLSRALAHKLARMHPPLPRAA